MIRKKICISTECTCDLPRQFINQYNIEILYFFITTENGRFKDTDEITSENILEYMSGGGKKSLSAPPSPDEYIARFTHMLDEYDEVIHIAISSGISLSCSNAQKALQEMGELGKRVHLIDSKHLSTGMGHIVREAAFMREKGCSTDEILARIEEMKAQVSTTFISMNADYLYRNGKVSKAVQVICSVFNIRPVLIMKNGVLKLKTIKIGSYDKTCRSYVRDVLKKNAAIDKSQLYITHAGCSVKTINMVKAEINKYCTFDRIDVTKASATISSNCGPNTCGLLFVRK